MHTDESIAYPRAVPWYQASTKAPLCTVEQYPHMIRCFGPVFVLWWMRFGAKHSFVKQIVKLTSCLMNVPPTLGLKHQFMIAFHMNSPSYGKSTLDVPSVSTGPVDVLKYMVGTRHMVTLKRHVIIKG